MIGVVSILDLFKLWLNNMAHLCTRFAWLVRGEQSVRPWDLDVGRHVRVGARKRRCLYACWGQLGFESLALATVFSLLFLAHRVALVTLPLHFSVVGRRHKHFQSLTSCVEQLLFLLFLLLELESF